MGGQTQYNLSPNPGQAGQPLSNDRAGMGVRTVRASVVVPFGVACEVFADSDGLLSCRPIQTATTGAVPAIVGISLADVFAAEMGYQVYAVPPSSTGSSVTGYPKGFNVPLVFRGGIWAAWDGNTGTALPLSGAINVWHSSDGTHNQGIFTTLAPATTAGAEIDSAGAFITVWDPNKKSGAYTDSFGNTINIVALNINLPGHS